MNRHEVHPLHGRAFVPGLAWQGVLLFREANVNHIRTCHYPPTRDLLEACDELGIFLEVEAPICWAHDTEAAFGALRSATVQLNLETVQRDKNHPSVIVWSLGNESHWNEYFAAAGRAVVALDPNPAAHLKLLSLGPQISFRGRTGLPYRFGSLSWLHRREKI